MVRILLTACIIFYAIITSAQQINKAEYFFNVDPGAGAATAINITSGDSISYIQNIQVPAALPAGINVLFVRVQNTTGTWSFPEIILIWKTTAPMPVNEMEYFFDTDPGFGSAIPLTVNNPGDSIHVFQNITVPALSLGQHKLYVRTKNSDGTWSFPEVHNMNICTAYGPTSDFSYYINGPETYFTDSSQSAISRSWNFGDNSVQDTTVNPRHVFQEGAIYQVKLKTTNSCGVDSIVKSITVPGVQSITPNKAGATGYYVGYIKGNGFLPGTTVRLLKDGHNIPADTTIFTNTGLLRVIFKNDNELTGLYDLLVTVPGSSEKTLHNAITIEPTKAADIWANLDGRRDLLANRWTTYRVVFGNNGNTVAAGVPIWISVPGSVSARLITDASDSSLPAELTDFLRDQFFIYHDSIMGDSSRYAFLLIPFLEPGQTGEIIFEIKTTSPANTHFPIIVQTANPYYSDQNFILGRVNGCELPPCMQCLMDVVSSSPGMPIFVACPLGAGSAICSIMNTLDDGSSNTMKAVSIVGQVSGAALSCIPGVSNLVSAVGKINWGRAGFAFAKEFAGGAGGFAPGGAPGSCGDCYKPPKPDSLNVRASSDPNIKTGPTGYNTLNYTRWQDPFNYTIHFENLATATAPASEVRIVDHLDTTLLDMNTFQFTGFGFSDTSTIFTIADSLFIKDIDLRPNKLTIVRVEGRLDSVNRVSFRFTSFDPNTMNLVTDFSQGFLNPNINGIEGLGYVRLQVRPKSGLPTGTLINNEASIIFDENPAIETPVWFNGIDKDKPASNVLPITDRIDDTTYRIHWTGTDTHAGVRWYSIYVSENDSAYVMRIRTDSLQFTFTGHLNSNYKFYSIAEDFVGNIEDAPPGFDEEITMTLGPLTVTLLDFHVFKQNKNAILQWKTATEMNNRGFEIQRSIDGINFMKIGWMNGAGNSNSQQNYFFIDSSPVAGKNFYRLKQIDFNGELEFSQVRIVDFSETRMFTIYPNPAKSNLTIATMNNNIAQIRIVDALGRIVYSIQNIRSNLISVPLSHLSSGCYIAEVTSTDERKFIQKFIKQ